MEELKQWVEWQIAIERGQLGNASSNDEYNIVQAKISVLERVLDEINFYISKKD